MSTRILVSALFVIVSPFAMADGWDCKGNNLDIKVRNHVSPSKGTRNAAILVISDPSISKGKRTTAAFSGVNISNSGATYTANVDLRFKTSRKGGRNIAGTKLSEVDTIVLDVKHNMNVPVPDGAEESADVTFNKRVGGGSPITHAVRCTRYLKN